MKKIHIVVIFYLITSSYACKKKNFSKDNFCLNNEVDAIKLAEKEWLTIYGNDVINSKKPFKAELINDSIWVVKGTLSFGELGGVPYAEINAINCKFIVVIHEK